MYTAHVQRIFKESTETKRENSYFLQSLFICCFNKKKTAYKSQPTVPTKKKLFYFTLNSKRFL